MLPASIPSSPEKKSKTPDLIARKYSLNSLNSILYRPYPRTWLLIALLFVQFILLLSLRFFPLSNRRTPFPDGASNGNFTFPKPPRRTAFPDGTSNGNFTYPKPPRRYHDECPFGRVFVYEMPKTFNSEILEKCDNLNPWSSRCDALSNDGFGRKAMGLDSLVPEDLLPAWYWTDQFVSEVIFHNRALNHKCRTMEPEVAKAFYVPFYAGLAVGKYLWMNYTARDRDAHCDMMLRWVQDQPYWKTSNGWDHFITMGRITWDFRRSKDHDWGSGCIYRPGMRNITRLLIERNPWDYFDVGVPYPTGFHPRSDSDVLKWQDFVRKRHRNKLFCFAGGTRSGIKNDFRGLLLQHCREEAGSCREVDCAGSRCSNGTSAILEAFLDSDFCLQPRGDSFTRRSIFDCMLAGSIPVFFWHRSAYMQYEWFLPEDPGSYSVFIDRNAVKNGSVSIKAVLEGYNAEQLWKMREKVIDYIPRIVYARNEKGLERIKDAFDVALEGVLRRFKVQENWYKWR